MRTGPIALGLVGIGIGAMGEFAPTVFPNAPQWVWVVGFYAAATMTIGAVFWGAWPFLPQIGRAIRRLLGRQAAKNIGPVYWSLSETLSWIAFEKAITAKQLIENFIAEGLDVRPQKETEKFNKAEQGLFEKLRATDLAALGKKDHSELYEEIPAEYFLSDVECKILHDQIDVSSENIGVMQRWSGPKWRDVRFKREDVLRLWPQNRKDK